MASLIPGSWDIPESIRIQVGSTVGRQSSIFSEGHLLLLLHEVPKQFQDDRVARLFLRKPDGTWHANYSKVSGIEALMSLIERFEKKVASFEERVESSKTASDWFQILTESAPQVRAAHRMSHVLQEAWSKIETDEALLFARDEMEGIERRAELVLQDAQFGLNFSVAKRGEEQSELSHTLAKQSRRLNLITALFLPVTAISGIFGMNLVSGLEHLDEPLPFFICVAIAFIVGLYVRSQLESAN